MDLWQKLTVDWPCMLGDWLWANIAMPLSALPRQLTVRRVIFLAALLVAAIALAQIFTLDVAFVMAGDVAFYCEIVSVVMLIAVRGHIRHAAQMAKRAMKHTVRRAVAWCHQRIGARRHHDGARPAMRDAGADDDEGVRWLGDFAAAL